MKERLNFDRVMMQMDLPCEVPPGSTLVEVIGNHRVLVENQVGVYSYSKSNISVRVRHGLVCIEGENLHLQQMTQKHLVITGLIFGISFVDWR